MKIDISLDTASIKSAIKQLNSVKKTIQKQAFPELLRSCCHTIIAYANLNLMSMGYEQELVNEIKAGWQPIRTIGNEVAIVQNHGRAYLVEFGVGFAGQIERHKKANSAGYKYNIPTEHKNKYGEWTFKIKDGRALDLIVNEDTTIKWTDKRGRKVVHTFGNKGAMFLYRAVQQFVANRDAEMLWKRIKAKYLA